MDDLSRPLIHYNDEMLVQKMEKFDFDNPLIDPNELAHIMAQSMIKINCFSLSAQQIGLPYRAFIISGTPMLCCFNPIIVDKTTDMEYLEEVCCSYPSIVFKKKRPKAIKVRYTQPNGEVITRKLIGLSARLFQHEMDHLNGILFHYECSRLSIELAIRRAKEIGHIYKQSDFKQKEIS